MNPGQDRDNKLLLLGCRFALIKLGIPEDAPLWNWMQQEFQAWLTGGYEQVLGQSMHVFKFKPRSTNDEQRKDGTQPQRGKARALAGRKGRNQQGRGKR